MIHIYDDLKYEVDDELIKLSEELVEQMGVLDSQSLDSERMKELNEKILSARNAYDDAKTVNDQAGIREAGLAFTKARQEKRSFETQRYNQRSKLAQKIEQLNQPIIFDLTPPLIDQAILRVRSQRSYPELIKRQVYFGDPHDYWVYTVETNRAVIWEAINLLIDGKAKLISMRRSSLSDLLSTIKEIEDKVNGIDLKKVEQVDMREDEYDKEVHQGKEEKPSTMSQAELKEMSYYARLGKETQVMDEARALIKKIKDEAAARVTNGRVTKYDQLGRVQKDALDVVYGKESK